MGQTKTPLVLFVIVLVVIGLVFIPGLSVSSTGHRRTQEEVGSIEGLKQELEKDLLSLVAPDSGKSWAESYGFIHVSDKDWAEMKTAYHREIKKYWTADPRFTPNSNLTSHFYYQWLWEPNFSCPHAERIGYGEGGKWICNVDAISAQEKCTMISIGSNNDFSFELEVLKRIPHCEIHVFDHTIKNPSRLPKNLINYHSIGLAEKTEVIGNDTFMGLQDIHKDILKGQDIDILKIDCEGCEWSTYKSWFSRESPFARQVLLEVHKGDATKSPFFSFMAENHYVTTMKEPNVAFSVGDDLCLEFAFLKLHPSFFA